MYDHTYLELEFIHTYIFEYIHIEFYLQNLFSEQSQQHVLIIQKLISYDRNILIW